MARKSRNRIYRTVAIALAVATVAISCQRKLVQVNVENIEEAPSQTVENMSAVQTTNGRIEMKMEAPLMERFEKEDKNSYESFPKGINVFAYTEEGLLETEIVSQNALHTTTSGQEKWSAFGNVVIKNYIKGERIETDTLYWDQEKQMIYTDCYVKLFSPDGFIQGFGMESDERARNAQVLKPFDSYGIITKDSTKVTYVDSANFIGPLYKR